MADADEALDAWHAVDLDQFQVLRRRLHSCQPPDQEQLVVGIRLAPERHPRVFAEPLEPGVFLALAGLGVGRVEVEGAAQVVAAQGEELGQRQVRHRSHGQRVGEHPEAAAKAGELQAVGDVVAAAQVQGRGLIAADQIGVAAGEGDGVDMRLESRPTGEAQFARHLPLGVGQARRLPRKPCTAGRVAAPLAQQLLGALALLFEIDPAVAENAGKGHTISSAALSAIRPGVACAMRGVDRLGAALSADGRRGERRGRL